jgi:hypothetical protein
MRYAVMPPPADADAERRCDAMLRAMRPYCRFFRVCALARYFLRDAKEVIRLRSERYAICDKSHDGVHAADC